MINQNNEWNKNETTRNRFNFTKWHDDYDI